MTKELIAGVVTLAGIAGGGWGASEYLHRTFANKDTLLVAGAQLQYIMTRQEASLVREIAALEREQERRALTAAEKYRLQNLREELKEMRQVRKGK